MGKLTLERLRDPKAKYSIQFSDLTAFLLRDGWICKIKGSHHIFKKAGFPLVNLQPESDKKAKGYQVDQVRDIYK